MAIDPQGLQKTNNKHEWTKTNNKHEQTKQTWIEKMIDKSKGKMEKYIMRKAFDTPENPYLPKEILWR